MGTVLLLITYVIVVLFPVRGVRRERITPLCEVVPSWDTILLWLQEVLGMVAVMCLSHLCSLDEHGNVVR